MARLSAQTAWVNQFWRTDGRRRLGMIASLVDAFYINPNQHAICNASKQRPNVQGGPHDLRRLNAVMPLPRTEQKAFKSAPYHQQKRPALRFHNHGQAEAEAGAGAGAGG